MFRCLRVVTDNFRLSPTERISYSKESFARRDGESLFAAVIPACNEAGRLVRVIKNLWALPLDLFIPVLNGCRDATLAEVLNFTGSRAKIIYFPEALGPDVPRAIGTLYALDQGARGLLYVDGDMVGNFNREAALLLEALERNVDLALCNCYPEVKPRHPLAGAVLYYRGLLNQELGLWSDIGYATPSHGPHAISRRLLLQIPLADLAVPPLTLVHATRTGCNVSVAVTLDHIYLGSRQRLDPHAETMAVTLIGDCIQAIKTARGETPDRSTAGCNYLGYDHARRRDILVRVLSGQRPLMIMSSFHNAPSLATI